MAKGTSRRGNAHYTPQSLTSVVGPTRTYGPSVTSTQSLLDALQEQRAYEQQLAVLRSDDRRHYHPARRLAGPGALIRRATQLHIGQVGRSVRKSAHRQGLPNTVKFRMPNLVSICVRRKIRREVYLALYKGKSRGSGASRRRNFWSDVKC